MACAKKLEEKNYGVPLHFIDMACTGKYFWFSALEWNGYYRLDSETGEIEFLGMFDNMGIWANKMFNRILRYHNLIFFIPWFSNHLVSLDTETLEPKYWELPEKIKVERSKFRTANIYNRKIFMFPHVGNDICIFNIENEKFECDSDWVKRFDRYGISSIKDKFLQGCQKSEIVYLANLSGSFIVQYSLDTHKCREISFQKSEKKIIDVVEYSNDELLVLTLAGNIWKYNIKNSYKELIYEYDGEKEYPYRHAVPLGNDIYLIPAREKAVKVLRDGKSNVISYPSNWKLQYLNVGIDIVFNGYCRHKDRILLFPCMGNMLLQIKEGEDFLQGIEVFESNPEIAERLYSKDIDHNILQEGKYFDAFISIVEGQKNKKRNRWRMEGNGLNIWNRMR